MNIELLQGTLEVTENPGLETIDPRLSDIATLMQDGKYEEAAAQSEAILEEQIYDIRIIGYSLYGHFIEQGVGAMADIYQCLANLLRDNLDALGPVKNREKHIQTILTWMMKQLIKKLQREEAKNTSIYEGWISEVSSDQVQEALDAGDELRRTLGPVLEDAAGSVLDGLMKVNDWLTAFQRLVYREPEPEVEEEPEEREEVEDEIEEAPRKEKKGGFLADSSFVDDGEGVGIEGSFHLKLLIRKLQAFDYLISKKNFSSAALIADDINSIIANFDPKVYFPKLFTRFSFQFAANINELFAFEEHKNSVEWQAMQELYKVDLESFVNFDSEGINLGASGEAGDYEEPEPEPDEHEDIHDEEEPSPEESDEEGGETHEDDEW
ncbi:MAG: hypothetical protein HF982_01910 [Desulfobacteraceae bacterium]|nr:hypothetical protein [Desulfobacteraceae bacterium]MBC2718349.1 hypothetical protein [Desulfobacteraceae bacterium]